jgi:hypothetical protein
LENLDLEDKNLEKKEKRKHVTESVERWKKIVPNQAIKESIHVKVIPFKFIFPNLSLSSSMFHIISFP